MIRKLNINELQILKSLYFNTIDYNKIKLSNQHLFSKLLKNYSGIVFDNTIVFTKRSYRDDFSLHTQSMSLLVHEICHVWQYQNLNYRWYKAGLEHIKFRTRTYKYNILDFKKLTDFRFEQQGEIMSDYYKLKKINNIKAAIYEDVIYSIIKPHTQRFDS